MRAYISLCASKNLPDAFDTKLAVFSNVDLLGTAKLEPTACNDDSCGYLSELAVRRNPVQTPKWHLCLLPWCQLLCYGIMLFPPSGFFSARSATFGPYTSRKEDCLLVPEVLLNRILSSLTVCWFYLCGDIICIGGHGSRSSLCHCCGRSLWGRRLVSDWHYHRHPGTLIVRGKNAFVLSECAFLCSQWALVSHIYSSKSDTAQGIQQQV